MTTGLIALAREVLPRDLWSDFDRSLGTPQFGPYHHEGPFMGSPGSHLELVLDAISAVQRGEFHPDVPEGVRRLMQAAASRHAMSVPMYVLLHDIDKIRCLTFVYGDGRKVPVSYTDWECLLREDPDGPAIRKMDGDSLRRFCERRGIRQISYYQNFGGGRERTHGKVTANRLRGRRDISGILVRAIRTHEIAFQFQARGGMNLPLFAETFRGWPEIELGFMLLVNYADQMGSLRPDGSPDLAAFVALARTGLAIPKFWEIHRRVVAETGKLDEYGAGRREQILTELWRSTTLLETESIGQAVGRIVAECLSSRG